MIDYREERWEGVGGHVSDAREERVRDCEGWV